MTLLRHVRMKRAARLLEAEAGLSIEEIATRVGFSSRSHFSRTFKEHHGASPGAFRTGDPSV